VNAYFKAVYDAMLDILSRVETVHNRYQDLSDRVDSQTVLNQVIGSRNSQRVNIGINFGPDMNIDGGDRREKRFYFGNGTTLLYWKRLSSSHKQDLEVVNFGSMMNILMGNGGLLNGYLRKYGGDKYTPEEASGSFIFTCRHPEEDCPCAVTA